MIFVDSALDLEYDDAPDFFRRLSPTRSLTSLPIPERHCDSTPWPASNPSASTHTPMGSPSPALPPGPSPVSSGGRTSLPTPQRFGRIGEAW
jgi:hypothetical protein